MNNAARDLGFEGACGGFWWSARGGVGAAWVGFKPLVECTGGIAGPALRFDPAWGGDWRAVGDEVGKCPSDERSAPLGRGETEPCCCSCL